MGQMEEVGAGVGAGALQQLELPPHDAELVPVELMEAEHASSGPWTTPGSTIAEVDYTKPFNCRSRLTASAREDPRVQEVSLGSGASALHKTQHRRAQRVECRPRAVRATSLIAFAPPPHADDCAA